MSVKSFEHALCRCRRALLDSHIRSNGRLCSNAVALAAAATEQQKAPFSSSRTRQKQTYGVPAFSITASPELDEIFRKLRTKLFLPAYLRPQQRKLIYKIKAKSMLENDPIILDIGSESFTLEHIDRAKDIPNSWKSIRRALEIMAPMPVEQWKNILPLLQGFKAAKIKLKDWQLERIIRDTTNVGMAHVILDAVQQVNTTGLTLANIRIAREVMWAFRALALQNGWELEHLQDAYRFARRAAVLMEEEGHKPPQGVEIDSRTEPDIIGVLLELAARNAVESHDDEDMYSVKLYMERLAPNLERVLSQPPPTEEELKWVPHADYELSRWIPVYEGLEIAEGLLGSALPHFDQSVEMRQKLEKERIVPAENAILASGEIGAGDKWRGRNWYKHHKKA